MVITIWILTLLGIGLWTLGAWGLHAVLSVDAATLSDWDEAIDRLPQTLPYAGLLDVWLPGWTGALKLGVSVVQTLLGWMGGAADVIVGVLWGSGALLMLGVAVLGTLAVHTLTRRMNASDRPATGSAAP
jgi:hypothetical protein